MASNLSTRKAIKIGLEDLKLLPEPLSRGKVHKPIHPAEIIQNVQNSIVKFNHEVVNTKIALNPKQTRMFATIDMEPLDHDLGRAWSVGVISSIDCSIALKLAAGCRVFICENLMASGDVFSAHHKHTKGFFIEEEIEQMVGKVLDNCKKQDAAIGVQAGLELKDWMAYQVAGKALLEHFMAASMVRASLQMWVREEYEDVRPRTVLGLHNAFTREVQKMLPTKQLTAAVKIGKFFEKVTHTLAA